LVGVVLLSHSIGHSLLTRRPAPLCLRVLDFSSPLDLEPFLFFAHCKNLSFPAASHFRSRLFLFFYPVFAVDLNACPNFLLPFLLFRRNVTVPGLQSFPCHSIPGSPPLPFFFVTKHPVLFSIRVSRTRARCIPTFNHLGTDTESPSFVYSPKTLISTLFQV